MRVLLTSAGLETEEIQTYFMNMMAKEMPSVKALFIPTAAIDADAIGVLPKCMNDLLKCGILKSNIHVFDLHTGMSLSDLQKFDVVYLCGGNTDYLIERFNESGFCSSFLTYLTSGGAAVGVSAGSLIFCSSVSGNLGLLDTELQVHCEEGEKPGPLPFPLKKQIRLTNTCALAVRGFPDRLSIIGR